MTRDEHLVLVLANLVYRHRVEVAQHRRVESLGFAVPTVLALDPIESVCLNSCHNLLRYTAVGNRVWSEAMAASLIQGYIEATA